MRVYFIRDYHASTFKTTLVELFVLGLGLYNFQDNEH